MTSFSEKTLSGLGRLSTGRNSLLLPLLVSSTVVILVNVGSCLNHTYREGLPWEDPYLVKVARCMHMDLFMRSTEQMRWIIFVSNSTMRRRKLFSMVER